MVGAGDSLAKATVWSVPNERRTLEELVADGPALFLVYLFDWSST
jgi:hypothetical protein